MRLLPADVHGHCALLLLEREKEENDIIPEERGDEEMEEEVEEEEEKENKDEGESDV